MYRMASVNWKESMGQTYEFYEVDPKTWLDKRKIETVKSVNITRDSTDETVEHATLEATDLDREMYLRVYLVVFQNGFKFSEPLGTFLIQTPSETINYNQRNSSIDAYSPLTELKEKKPSIGFTILKGEDIMNRAAELSAENMRAPVIKASSSGKVVEQESGFVANTDDNWLSFTDDLIANAEYTKGLTPLGEMIFLPNQNVSRMNPVEEFSDDEQSILYPEITLTRDLYGIPNVVEVVHSTDKNFYIARCVNDDPSSPTSTIRRGREIVHRVTSPDSFASGETYQLDDYAEQLLKSLSNIEYKISFTHGYCPVRLGDCVRITYKEAGLYNVKAKIIRQTIRCETGCSISEEAVYTSNLWKE